MALAIGARVGPLYVAHLPQRRHGVLWALTIGPVVYTLWICAAMMAVMWWVIKWTVVGTYLVIRWLVLAMASLALSHTLSPQGSPEAVEADPVAR